jgi:hypothetical protein
VASDREESVAERRMDDEREGNMLSVCPADCEREEVDGCRRKRRRPKETWREEGRRRLSPSLPSLRRRHPGLATHPITPRLIDHPATHLLIEMDDFAAIDPMADQLTSSKAETSSSKKRSHSSTDGHHPRRDSHKSSRRDKDDGGNKSRREQGSGSRGGRDKDNRRHEKREIKSRTSKGHEGEDGMRIEDDEDDAEVWVEKAVEIVRRQPIVHRL